MFRDPVCGMEVEPEHAAASMEHAGKMYYFCCQACCDKFRSAPDAWLKAT